MRFLCSDFGSLPQQLIISTDAPAVTHFYPVLAPAQEAQRCRDLTWCVNDSRTALSELHERFHDEHLVARVDDSHFHRLVGDEGWSPDALP
jgi:hypothetical protein